MLRICYKQMTMKVWGQYVSFCSVIMMNSVFDIELLQMYSTV